MLQCDYRGSSALTSMDSYILVHVKEPIRYGRLLGRLGNVEQPAPIHL